MCWALIIGNNLMIIRKKGSDNVLVVRAVLVYCDFKSKQWGCYLLGWESCMFLSLPAFLSHLISL